MLFLIISGLWLFCCWIVYYTISFLFVENISTESQASNYKSLLCPSLTSTIFLGKTFFSSIGFTLKGILFLVSNFSIRLLIWVLWSEKCLIWGLCVAIFFFSYFSFVYLSNSSNLLKRWLLYDDSILSRVKFSWRIEGVLYFL